MIDPQPLARRIEAFHPDADGEAAKSRELILALLAFSPAPFSRRQFNPGHITCSGLVLGPAGDRILLVLHRRLQRWLLPGGHVEPDDPSLAAAASREVIEETGAVLLPDPSPPLAGMDVHGIPPRQDEPFHLHHDLTFCFRAASLDLQPSEEVREVAWCAAQEFDRYLLPANLRNSYGRARAWLKPQS